MADDIDGFTTWQLKMRNSAQQLVPDVAPEPWNNYQCAPAAGVFAAGWTTKDHFVMLSGDGYSINDPKDGKQLLFDQDADGMFQSLSEDTIHFRIPATGEAVLLFGLRSGDGVHVTKDWNAEVIYPWWPNATVVMYRSTILEWDTVYALKLRVCDPGNWVKCGFSPSGTTLAVVGHAGAEFFSRVGEQSIVSRG